MKLIFLLFFLTSCNVFQLFGGKTKLDSSNSEKDTIAISTLESTINKLQDVHHEINLSYESESIATSCFVYNEFNLEKLSLCSCENGKCSIKIKGKTSFTGKGSFLYKIQHNEIESKETKVNINFSSPSLMNDSWTYIPSNSGNMGLNHFFVMTNEASVVNTENGEIPTSTNNLAPKQGLNAYDAYNMCKSLGDDFFLISNKEWMAIARNIEKVDKNWTGGLSGSGCLFRGNSGETVCGYDSSVDPDFSDTRESDRYIFTLNNGSLINDFSGNLNEWVDFKRDVDGYQSVASSCSESGSNIDSIICNELFDEDYNSEKGYLSIEGVGKFSIDSQGGLKRGGYYASNNGAGIFSFFASGSPSSGGSFFGFRCVYRPSF